MMIGGVYSGNDIADSPKDPRIKNKGMYDPKAKMTHHERAIDNLKEMGSKIGKFYGLGRGDDRFQPFNHGIIGRAIL